APPQGGRRGGHRARLGSRHPGRLARPRGRDALLDEGRQRVRGAARLIRAACGYPHRDSPGSRTDRTAFADEACSRSKPGAFEMQNAIQTVDVIAVEIQALRHRVQGEVVTPADANWD